LAYDLLKISSNVKTIRLPLPCTAVFGLLLAFSQNANAITKLDYTNGNDRYVDHLVGMVVGSSDKDNGQSYYRSTNIFGSMPKAVLASLVSGTSTSMDLGAVGTYRYKPVESDGPIISVPDGGATVMLLGVALGALGMARRFLKS
jgi:hypothetical protein